MRSEHVFCWYRGFIDGYSRICAPLTSLTGKGIPWRWDVEQQEAFECLKAKFIAEPALAQWDPDNETMLEVDSSGYAIGGCLLQKQKGEVWKPVAYYSRKLSGPEINYEIHDKELLAVVACMKEWDAELRGLAKSFTILSDHMNLKLLNPINLNKIFIDDLPLAEYREVFVNKDLQTLWDQALKNDQSFKIIVKAVRDNERQWTEDLRVQIEGSKELKPLKAMIIKIMITRSPVSIGEERAKSFVEHLANVTTFMQAAMAAVQERSKYQANKRRNPASRYVVVDKVWLLLRNIKLDGQPSKKLGLQHAKYQVTKVISPEMVELNVNGKIFNHFHVDLLLTADENP
ncbi:hypothetical protein K3495_g9834 [Podosphaera aphanis]|nr:hypothetical protein K3495_g9834 [Podosphaera aphanis]